MKIIIKKTNKTLYLHCVYLFVSYNTFIFFKTNKQQLQLVVINNNIDDMIILIIIQSPSVYTYYQ